MKKKHTALKIIVSVLVILIIGFFLTTEIPVCTVGESEHNDYSTFLRDCNHANANFIDTPITKIAMLGSHDALADNINLKSAPNRSENNIVNNDVLRVLSKGLMVRLSRAQRDNVYEQLKAGVRYLDVRITNIGENYYNSHGLISDTLENNLMLILKFLDENPGELVLFEAKKYYQDIKNSDDLVSYISYIKYNDKSLFDYINYPSSITKFGDLTYGMLTDGGSKAGVLLFSDEIFAAPFNQFSYNYYYSKHHDEMKTDLIIQGMRKSNVECQTLGADYLRINQAQTTPHEKKIWDSFVSWSLLAKAESHNQTIINLPDFIEICKNIPIYMVDYSTNNKNKFNDKYISIAKSINFSL